MQLVYNVQDKPKFNQLLVFAFQQLLAIMAATIAVPNIIGNGMSPAAALVGAGVGTIVYLLFTRFKSPVFLGSSFAFIGSMLSAFAGGVSMALGYLGMIVGAVFAGLVYVIIAVIVKLAGTKWIAKIMPAVVIGPTVAIIGLSLSGSAIGQLVSGPLNAGGDAYMMTLNSGLCLICGLTTLAVTMLCSTFGKKMVSLIPFIIGILGGYALAAIFTAIGLAAGIPDMVIINFDLFAQNMLVDGNVGLQTFVSLPEFTFLTAIEGVKEFEPSYLATIAVAYVPVAFVVFAEHLADHKNLSTIIEKDLLEEPGLHRTLLGDGVGSMVGAFFGGCPNTTYGESVGCVAITRNASVRTIFAAAIMAIVVAFVTPFVTFLETIPACVMGGVCVALYGFIAVSGLKMIQKVDLEQNSNLFVVSVILITGIGNLALQFGDVTLRTVACSLILGIITNAVLNRKKKDAE
ncbi:MAG: uracil-xanthine permease [Oscillospiraceae bacterium]|nr:uracil-xanthine permease [Oscillospiraceae bacterium]